MNGWVWRNLVLPTTFVVMSLSAWGQGYKYHVPYFISAASNGGDRDGDGDRDYQESFVRVLWSTCQYKPDLTITAVDDSGKFYEPIDIPWRPGPSGCGEIVNFNSRDLEDGNPDKGISEGIGPPDVGDWQLFIESPSPVTVASYVRTAGGFLTSMNDVAPWYPERNAYYVSTFNPGRNENQRSKLRIINPNAVDIRVNVLAQHDQLVDSYDYGPSILLAPLEAITVTAEDLETYHSEWVREPFGGQIGENGHAGKWRLYLRAIDQTGPDYPNPTYIQNLIVMNIMDTPGGYITNLSSVPDLRSVVIEEDPAVRFNIDVVFKEDVSSVVRDKFRRAAEKWEAIITGDVSDWIAPYQVGVGHYTVENGEAVDDLLLVIEPKPAGEPCCATTYIYARDDNHAATRPTVALIRYNDDQRWEIAAHRQFENIAVHELGHALGFETDTFDTLDLIEREPTTHFTGADAIQAFDDAGGEEWDGDKVPMEDRYAHWRDADRLCGVGILDEEIMARYICSGSNVSLITLKALAEIGYEITSVPRISRTNTVG